MAGSHLDRDDLIDAASPSITPEDLARRRVITTELEPGDVVASTSASFIPGTGRHRIDPGEPSRFASWATTSGGGLGGCFFTRG